MSPNAIAGELSIAKRQMVEIARASAFQCEVVIFDEPTASLTETEAEALFETIQRLRHQGVAIAYISHKIKEIFRVSDRVTVLRDGEVRGTLRTRGTNEDEVTRLMIGRTRTAISIVRSDALGPRCCVLKTYPFPVSRGM